MGGTGKMSGIELGSEILGVLQLSSRALGGFLGGASSGLGKPALLLGS